ncbi:MAG: hypothetical protein RR902_02595 [Oscillospiraceae bacterium]
MIKLITGTKGTGKTKTLIEMINGAAKTTPGNIVCIEKSMKLTYDVDHAVRLIDVDEYGICGYDRLYGFIAGIMAGNYDIVEIYIDGVLKIGDHDISGLGKLLADIEKIAKDSVKLVVTVSADEKDLPDSVKMYI